MTSKCYVILWKGLKHLYILVSSGVALEPISIRESIINFNSQVYFNIFKLTVSKYLLGIED